MTFFLGTPTRVRSTAHQDESAVEEPLSEEPPLPESEPVEATGEEEQSSAEEDHHPVTDHGESITDSISIQHFSTMAHGFFIFPSSITDTFKNSIRL